jgi:hypothetical protein
MQKTFAIIGLFFCCGKILVFVPKINVKNMVWNVMAKKREEEAIIKFISQSDIDCNM